MRRLFDRFLTAILAAAWLAIIAAPAQAQSDNVDVGHVVEDGAEVRAGAGSSYYLVGRLKKGTIVNIDDRFFEWYKVTPPPSVYSYVKKQYVTPGASGSNEGTINKDRAPVFAAAVSGPGESYRRQVDLHKGDAVTIEKEEGDYYLIRSPRHAYVYIRVAAVKRAEFIPAEAVTATTTTETSTPAAEATATTTTTTTTPGQVMTTVTKVVEPKPAETTTTVTDKAKAAADATAKATADVAKAAVDTTVKAADTTVKATADAVDTVTTSQAGTGARTATQDAVEKTVDTTVAAAKTTGDMVEDATGATATVATDAGASTKAMVDTAAESKPVTATATTVEKVTDTTGGAVMTAAETTVKTTETVVETTVETVTEKPTIADRTRTAATEAGDAASRAMDATVRGAGTALTKTGEAIASAANATKELIDPTPEPIVAPAPKVNTAAPVTTTTTTAATISTPPPPRVSDNTSTGDIRIPPLTEGRMVTASSEGTVTRGPAPPTVDRTPSRLTTTTTPPATETITPEAPVEMGPATDATTVTETTTTAESTGQAASAPSDLAGLEAQLAEAEKLPLEQQPLSSLLAGYEALYSQPGMMPEDRRAVLQRIIKLRRNIALAATLREIDQMQQTLSSAPTATVTPVVDAAPRGPQYDAVGQLLASGVYDGVNLPRLYRVVSPRMRTIAYVRPTPTLDAVAMLGKIVGVEGETRYDQALKLRVLEPTSIVVLSPEAAGITP